MICVGAFQTGLSIIMFCYHSKRLPIFHLNVCVVLGADEYCLSQKDKERNLFLTLLHDQLAPVNLSLLEATQVITGSPYDLQSFVY